MTEIEMLVSISHFFSFLLDVGLAALTRFLHAPVSLYFCGKKKEVELKRQNCPLDML